MPAIASKKSPMKAAANNVKRRAMPLWEGPAGEGPQGGVTQGLIGRWLCCRERFRLMVIEGLKPQDKFDPRMEFGNMWHVCEEGFAAGKGIEKIMSGLIEYCKKLCVRYPMQRAEVEHWFDKCRTMFPLYTEFWKKHPDVLARTPLLQEQVFDVPYKLPSGRVVRLRGKFDSVDLIG